MSTHRVQQNIRLTYCVQQAITFDKPFRPIVSDTNFVAHIILDKQVPDFFYTTSSLSFVLIRGNLRLPMQGYPRKLNANREGM